MQGNNFLLQQFLADNVDVVNTHFVHWVSTTVFSQCYGLLVELYKYHVITDVLSAWLKI